MISMKVNIQDNLLNYICIERLNYSNYIFITYNYKTNMSMLYK